MKALGAVAALALPLSAQVTIHSDLGEDGDRVARELLAARLQVPIAIEPRLGSIGERRAVSSRALLLGVRTHDLQLLAAQGLLVPTELPDLEPPFRGPDALYAITLLSPYDVAYDRDRREPVDVPASWDDLISVKYQDRLVVGDPLAMPELWDLWWRRELRRGEGERRAVAWLTTLDARVDYANSGAGVRRKVIDGEAALGILPRHLLKGTALGRRLLPGEVAAAGLGVAWQSADVEDAESAAVHAVLVSAAFNRELAAALDLVPAPHAGEDPASRSALDQDVLGRLQPWASGPEAWMERAEFWAKEIRGRGQVLEDLSESLDLILAVLFLGFLVFVYTRIRKSEPRSAGISRAD